jgi:hypothetical protein
VVRTMLRDMPMSYHTVDSAPPWAVITSLARAFNSAGE